MVGSEDTRRSLLESGLSGLRIVGAMPTCADDPSIQCHANDLELQRVFPKWIADPYGTVRLSCFCRRKLRHDHPDHSPQ